MPTVVANNKYPFRAMNVGDSFAVPSEIDIHNLRYAAAYFGKRNDRKYSTRKTASGYRCWRIE